MKRLLMKKSKQSIIKLSKIELAQYDLNRQTAKISALSSEIDDKYEFVTSEDVLPEKGLLEKTSAIKKFEYLPLGSELRKQTDIVKKTISRVRQGL